MLVSSRSFDEYMAMFALDDDALSATILDCPAGASSFTAVARDRGARVTACDVAYAHPHILPARARAEAFRGNAYVASHADDYTTAFFRSTEHHLAHRLDAIDCFARDVTARPESYVAGALPQLPFADGVFDLVLSSHMLFTYADRLEVDTHHAYLRELLRVANREVRMFPLVSVGSSQRYPYLDTLRRLLAGSGIHTAVVVVGYEFQRGGTEMLVCRRG